MDEKNSEVAHPDNRTNTENRLQMTLLLLILLNELAGCQ